MNELTVFDNDEFGSIRTLTIEGEPWFVGKDVAGALGYNKGKSPSNAVKNHVDDEDKGVTKIMTPGGEQNMTIINESGLYSLILSSKLPSAKRFKRWVTAEVLPTLRKTGCYTTPEAASERELYIRAASIVGNCKTERLPIVLKLLERGGLDIPQIEAARKPGRVALDVARDTTGETARLINLAINDFGLTAAGIGRMTGLATTQIQRIRRGESKPTLDRSNLICTTLRAEISRMD